MKTMTMSLLLIMFLAFSMTACNEASVSTEDEKTLYVMGRMLGGNLQRLELSEDEAAALAQGVKDAAVNKESSVNVAEYQVKIQTLFKERMSKIASGNVEQGKGFIEDFLKKNPEAKKTDSGLVFLSVEEGKGKTPGESDKVKVNYHGTLSDGTVFDSTKEKGKPVVLELNRVIKGWKEGMKMMKEGGKAKLVIPADLAYGNVGAPPKIPAGATIMFDIELIEVVEGGKKK